jgi:hypothetical protein
MNIEDDFIELVLDYIFKEFHIRSENDFDIKKQASFITDFFKNTKTTSVFDDANITYKIRLNKILDSYPKNDVDRMESDIYRSSLIEKIIFKLIEKTKETHRVQIHSKETQTLKNKITDLEFELLYGKPAKDIKLIDKITSPINIPYLMITLLSTSILVVLVFVGLITDISLNIEINIGEIIGGILAGTGVAVAGISYANKKPENNSADK